jgi:hypothetical protein
VDDEFEIGEHKDGFYKYSQEVEEENSRLQSRAVKTVSRERSSQSKGKQPAMDDQLDIGERKNGHKYSQEMLEEGDRGHEPRTMRASDSTEASYASAVSGRDSLNRHFATDQGKKLTQSQQMPPIETPTLPYTVGSSEWHSFAAREQLLDNPYGGEAVEKFGSVLSVFSKVYTIAKIFAWCLRMYGVDVSR